MRIAMLGHKRIPSREGGVEIVVEQLAVRMARRGHAVTCYNRGGHHVSGKAFDTSRQKEHKGVRLLTVPTVDVKGFAAMSASIFASIRAAFGKYDVVHFHTEGPCVTLWLPKLLGKRCIVTVHGLDHQRSKWGRFARKYILWGERAAARFADEIIVLSKGVQAYFRNVYQRETKLIPNGLTLINRRDPQLITEKYGAGKDEYILYLARITPEKGVHYLIEAYKQLDTDKKLVIAGGASDAADYYRRLKEMAADDPRIIFTDFIQGQELEEWYSNALIYVLPSELEGMPISLLEAISCGNCCLVSDIAENRDVVGACGNTFRSGDVKDLADKLAALLADPARIACCREASVNRRGELLSWEDVTTRTLETYQGTPAK